MAAKTTSQPDGSVGAALIAIAVLISLWQAILVLVIVIAVILAIRYIIVDSKRRGRMPAPIEEPWPELAAEPPPKPKPEPYSPEYAPRWTKSRRKDAKRELAQWQELFDTHAV